jgi:omega-6 fatty acid desaturase (delta-12 desaturase)
LNTLARDAQQSGQFSPALRTLARDLSEASKPFAVADNSVAARQLIITSLLFFPLVALMFVLAADHYALALPLALPAGGLLTRFFALQHDCGHGSFFTSGTANALAGRGISLLTLTPYDYWRRSHAMHHAGSGNLDRRGIGDVDTLTVREYAGLGFWGRLRYRFIRHPLVALVIGPPIYFLVLQRLMFNRRLGVAESLKSIASHDVVLLLFYGTLVYLLGFGLVASVVLPVVLVGAWIGGALFYVQHQFEETLWDSADRWDVKVAALKGSSHLMLPRALNWLTCDIGIHHVHHLSSRIPNYRLRACLEALPALQNISPKLHLRDAIHAAGLALWDEKTRKLISFREFHMGSA